MKLNRSERIMLMMLGNRSVIKDCLNSDNAYLRLDSLIWAAYFKFAEDDVIARIKELKSDEDGAMGYKVKNYAVAALDVMNVEKYSGNDKNLQDLIANFLPTKSEVEQAIKDISAIIQNESA